jgi:hypothetical protein
MPTVEFTDEEADSIRAHARFIIDNNVRDSLIEPYRLSPTQQLVIDLAARLPVRDAIDLLAEDDEWHMTKSGSVLWTIGVGMEKVFVSIERNEFPTHCFSVLINEDEHGMTFYRDTAEEAVALARGLKNAFEQSVPEPDFEPF